jgi:hypothetical protein
MNTHKLSRREGIFAVSAVVTAGVVMTLALTHSPTVKIGEPVTASPSVSVSPVSAPTVTRSGGFGSLTSTTSPLVVSGSAGSLGTPVPRVTASPAAKPSGPAPARSTAVKTPAPVAPKAPVVVSPAPVKTVAPAAPSKAPVAPVAPVAPPVAKPAPSVAPVVPAAPATTAPSSRARWAECTFNGKKVAEVKDSFHCVLVLNSLSGLRPQFYQTKPGSSAPSLGSATAIERLTDGRFNCYWNTEHVATVSTASHCGLITNDLDGLSASWA